MNKKTFIKELKSKNWNMSDISTQVGVTPERVRQILNEKIKNNKLEISQYRRSLSNVEFLLKEIVRLSKTNRQKENVEKKRVLISMLRTKFNLSYVEIASLLKKDHTTIIHYLKEQND